MATGPDHYRAAEQLLADEHVPADPELGIGEHWLAPSRMHLAAAQVHASLALAAATALNNAKFGMPSADAGAWQNTAGSRDR